MSTALHPDQHDLAWDADLSGRERAAGYLAALLGDRPATITWDHWHRLQGHVHVGTHELVIIAPHDAAHVPVVLDSSTWDAVQHSPADERRRLLQAEAITGRDQLIALVEQAPAAAA